MTPAGADYGVTYKALQTTNVTPVGADYGVTYKALQAKGDHHPTLKMLRARQVPGRDACRAEPEGLSNPRTAQSLATLSETWV